MPMDSPDGPANIQEMFDLSGQVAVVTGAGRGIGEGIAKTLARAGAAVGLAARRTEEVDRVAKEIAAEGHQALAVTTDVTDEAAVERLAAETEAAFGRLSIWVNNAGGSPVQAPLTRLDRASWDDCVALNLTAVWISSVVAARHMETGSIINISSRAATGPIPGSGHYAACKAGVNSLTETMAKELGPKIRVNCIMPGAVPTEIMMEATGLRMEDMPKLVKGAGITAGRVGTPFDIGAAALFLAAPASSWITGEIMTVTGGM